MKLIEKHQQKDNKGTGKLNLYKRTNNLGETEYIYQETPDSEEILLTPTNKRFSDDPTNWDYKDANGREYSPRMVKSAVAQAELKPYEKDWYHKMTEALGYDWLINKSNGYYNNPILGAAARWAASYDNNTNPIKGLWNSPLAYGNVYSMAAKAADNLFLDPNGLQKTIALYNNSDGSYADRNAWQKSLLGDVVEASMISPAVREAYKGSEPLINASKTYLQNNYPAVFDPYTSWDATLGYHGDNIFSRALGTVGRRYGYTPKVEVPEFHRRLAITKPESFRLTDDGKFIMSSGRTGEGHEGIVNFTTSEAARSHNKHKYLSGIDDFIVHPKALEKASWKSIQPSDTFLEMPLDNSTLAIDPKYITFVSGEPEALNYARSIGMKTLSSPKLRALEANKPVFSGLLDRINSWKGAHSENARSIGNEIQRLTSMRGAPTMKDYAYFEDATGLNSGVVPSSQWTSTNEEALFGRSSGVRGVPIFNHVAYDPATSIESIYRKAKIGEIPWSDYYEALNKMPSARAQLQVADTPQITAENAASITPKQWTTAQDAAIARGDMAEAQRLRDLHADVNGYNSSLSLYHGSPVKFNEFKAVPNFEGYTDYFSHFSVNPSISSKFGDIRRFYTNVRNPLRVTDQGARWNPSKLANELGIQPKYVKDPLEPYWREFQNIEGRGMYKEANRKFMEDELKGDAYIYDNTIEGGGDSYAIPTSRQVKLADAVTYDDKGIRIPLGERDNFNINDIRYGLLPFGIGLTGYGLYKKRKGGKMNTLQFLKNGSGIHIKKKNRGKFTSYCGGKVTNACIQKAKASGNPTLVKRATFAQNARKWKHSEGGNLHKWSSNFGRTVDSNPNLDNMKGDYVSKKLIKKKK